MMGITMTSFHLSVSGCPAGFTRHMLSCYLFVNVTKNWVEAEKHCQTLHRNSHLVGIETEAEQAFLFDFRNYNTGKELTINNTGESMRKYINININFSYNPSY